MRGSHGVAGTGVLKLPCCVVANRLDSPVKLLSERLGEEFLDGHIYLVAEDNSQAGVDVVLHVGVSN